MTKSSQHHASVKYFFKPYADCLISISTKNVIVKARSTCFSANFSVFRFSRSLSSIACQQKSRCDTTEYFDARSKTDVSQFNLARGTETQATKLPSIEDRGQTDRVTTPTRIRLLLAPAAARRTPDRASSQLITSRRHNGNALLQSSISTHMTTQHPHFCIDL